MPRKVRELMREEEAAGIRVTISGPMGDDAKPYQEREVRRAIAARDTTDGHEETAS